MNLIVSLIFFIWFIPFVYSCPVGQHGETFTRVIPDYKATALIFVIDQDVNCQGYNCEYMYPAYTSLDPTDKTNYFWKALPFSLPPNLYPDPFKFPGFDGICNCSIPPFYQSLTKIDGGCYCPLTAPGPFCTPVYNCYVPYLSIGIAQDTCQCNPLLGYGQLCQQPICGINNACSNQGTCQGLVTASPSCLCQVGFGGPACQWTCASPHLCNNSQVVDCFNHTCILPDNSQFVSPTSLNGSACLQPFLQYDLDYQHCVLKPNRTYLDTESYFCPYHAELYHVTWGPDQGQWTCLYPRDQCVLGTLQNMTAFCILQPGQSWIPTLLSVCQPNLNSSNPIYQNQTDFFVVSTTTSILCFYNQSWVSSQIFNRNIVVQLIPMLVLGCEANLSSNGTHCGTWPGQMIPTRLTDGLSGSLCLNDSYPWPYPYAVNRTVCVLNLSRCQVGQTWLPFLLCQLTAEMVWNQTTGQVQCVMGVPITSDGLNCAFPVNQIIPKNEPLVCDGGEAYLYPNTTDWPNTLFWGNQWVCSLTNITQICTQLTSLTYEFAPCQYNSTSQRWNQHMSGVNPVNHMQYDRTGWYLECIPPFHTSIRYQSITQPGGWLFVPISTCIL